MGNSGFKLKRNQTERLYVLFYFPRIILINETMNFQRQNKNKKFFQCLKTKDSPTSKYRTIQNKSLFCWIRQDTRYQSSKECKQCCVLNLIQIYEDNTQKTALLRSHVQGLNKKCRCWELFNVALSAPFPENSAEPWVGKAIFLSHCSWWNADIWNFPTF
jgi:hypothetical protein